MTGATPLDLPELSRIAAGYPEARLVVLFGSVARSTPFAWSDGDSFKTYRLDKFLEVAARVMARRSVVLSERGREQLSAAHAARWKA